MNLISSPPPNSFVKVLFLIVTLFGVKVFKEVIKVKQGHKDGTLIQ